MLLGVNKSLLALTVVTGTLLTGCNEASPDQKSTNPTQNIVKPDAPVGPIVNDDLDQFGWSWSHNLSDKQFYEIKIPNQPWSTVNGNPHQLVIDGIYAAGDIQIRVKADSSKNRTASDVLVNPIIYTANSLVKRPKSPTNPVQNDSLNTFDWEFVSSFSTANEYEYSLTGGVSWTTVANKPLNVGDVDIDVGHVQVRVKENTADGTVAGAVLISTQAFTSGVSVVIAAPTAPVIVNANIGNTNYPYEVKTNGFSWDWVTNSNTGADYDEPEHYEFTNDGGMTWQTVTSRPQHIGPKAYAKNKVGVRVKKNAISNQINPAGQTLYATAATSDFYVTRIVPMVTWKQANALTYNGNWNRASNMGCYIEYDVQGENPQFWAYAGDASSANKVSELLNKEFCDMPNWQLLGSTEMKVKTLVDSSYIAGTFKSYLVTSDSYYKHWASETVSDLEALKAISAGQEVSASYGTRVIQKWELPDTAKILTETTSTNTALNALVSSQNSNWQTTSTDLIAVINNIDSLVDQPLTPLLSAVTTTETEAKTTFDSLALALTEYQDKINLLTLYSTMLESDSSVDKALKATLNNDIASIKVDFINLTSLHTSFKSVLKVTPALSALIKLTDQKTTANSVRDTLLAANYGADIHGRSLDLFAAAALINDFIKANVSLVADLNSATSELPVASNTALISALDKLLIMFNNLPTAVDADALTAHAIKGLERASSAGYSVAAADAVIGTHFAKLDINGDYLPSATTYARGWRCVMDSRDLVRKRIWTLLKDGLPNGADDLAFDASSAGIASVMGAGGLIELKNNVQFCGRSDWSLPKTNQLKSLETAMVNSGKTIDVDVFRNHLALKPEYDIAYHTGGGTVFWYWTADDVNKNAKIYHYKTDNKSATSSSASKQGDEDKVVLSRLVSEIKLTYQLLDSAGGMTTDVDAAVCAYQPESKQTWQLFDTADTAIRIKNHGNSSSEVDTVLAEVERINNEGLCNKTNWRVPSLAELQGLSPVDSTVFRFNNVEKSGSSLCYVSADTAQFSRNKCYNMRTDGISDVNKAINSWSSKYVYRLTASE
ncbi:hypothetical protein [Moritella dasanensis]|uniref:hypothetical protein n=1 Tax=Moritella dasanensis TaxID=428031 RepID=UPI0002D93321|nr:hypothetical protein [Moritella dasanensis]